MSCHRRESLSQEQEPMCPREMSTEHMHSTPQTYAKGSPSFLEESWDARVSRI